MDVATLGNLKLLLIVAQNGAKKNKYIKAKINETQENIKWEGNLLQSVQANIFCTYKLIVYRMTRICPGE